MFQSGKKKIELKKHMKKTLLPTKLPGFLFHSFSIVHASSCKFHDLLSKMTHILAINDINN